MELSRNVKEDPKRWVILTLFALSKIGNSMIFITFSPITVLVSEIYDVSVNWVEMCTLVFMVTYIPVTFPANYVLDNYGLRTGMLLGSGLTMLGSFLRLGAFSSFWWILLGNLLVAIGKPFLANASSKVAAFWFKPESRTFATTIGSTCIPAGMMIGYAVPLLVTEGEGKAHIGILMLIQCVFATVVALSVYLLFDSNPMYPPSVTATERRESFSKSIWTCLSSKSFLLLLVSFSFAEGTLSAIAAMIDPLCNQSFFHEQISMFGIIEILAGLVSSLVISQLVGKNQKFKSSIVTLMGFGVLGILLMYATIGMGSFVLTGCLFGLVGLLLTPTMPLSFELGSELTYPAGEATIVGLLNSAGQLVAVVETQLAASMGNTPGAISTVLVLGLLIGIVGMTLCKEEFKRSFKDQQEFEINLSTYLS